MTDSQTDWEKRFNEEFYYARTNVDDNDYSIIKDKSDNLPAGIDQIRQFIKQELSHQATEILSKVERELIGENIESTSAIFSSLELLRLQRQALQKIKERYDHTKAE